MPSTETTHRYRDTFQHASPALLSGKLRTKNEDFIVDEIPTVTPVGSGEHIWLKIKKSGENTDWVAGMLARIAGVKRRDVSYAGMKDKNAVTTQWFSIYLPRKTSLNWQADLPDNINILEETRHERKLRLGTLQGNHFEITLRDCEYINGGNKEKVEQRIQDIRNTGVPNYFGEQRFGRDFNNLKKAEAWFAGEFHPKKRNLQGIFLSSARSWIFNQILSQRVQQGNWNQAIKGDVFMFDTSRSWFTSALDNSILQRVKNHEIHPTAALWGQGELASEEDMRLIEDAVGQENQHFIDGLCKNKLKQERRKLRLSCHDLSYKWLNSSDLQLEFSLPSGTYATSLLKELIIF